MPTPMFGDIPQMNTQNASLEELRTYVGQLQNHLTKQQRDLKYLLGTLDYENIFAVGGWRVTPDQLASKDEDVGMSTEDTAADDIRFWAGDVKTGTPLFYVTKSGKMFALDGTFIGTITANAGTIGGWVITATTLKDAAGLVGMLSTVSGGDDIRFFAGHATPSSAPFLVTESGYLKAAYGAIGGWVIGATLLADAAGLVGMSSVVSGGDDIRFWAGNATPANAPWRVYESGLGVATSWIIQSATTGERVVIDSTGFHSYDSSGIERITIGTTPAEGAKALIGRDSSGTAQSVYTYDTATVDGASRTGQFITAHGAYALIDSSGNIRMQCDTTTNGEGFRARKLNRPEINAGSGWNSIAYKSEADAAASAASAAQSTANSKQDAFSGFTGTQTIVESVDFGASTSVDKVLHFTNGVLTSIT